MTKITVVSDETKVESITKALGGSRKFYESADTAIAALTAAAEKTESFYGLNIAIAGINAETGEIDSAVYSGMRAMIATVGTRVDTGTKKLNGIKGIVLLPVPDLDAFMATDEGRDWLEKIANKEAAHVAFRPFRDANTADEFLSGTERVPTTVEAFATESARSGGVDTETFDTLWKDLRIAIGKDKPALAKLLPQKPEVIKSIRSAAHAKAEYPELEKIGAFVWLANLVINGADGLDTGEIKKWLAGRAEFVFPTRAASEPDFSALEGMDLLGELGGDDSESDEVAPATK